MRDTLRRRGFLWTVALLLVGLLTVSGCSLDDPFVVDFLPSLEVGITSIVSGLVAGVFNAITAVPPDDEGLAEKATGSLRPR